MRRWLTYLLIGVPGVAVTVAGGLAILLPQLAAARLASKAESRYGLTMTVEGGSGLSLDNGLAVTLDNVSLTRSSAQGVPFANIGRIRIESPLAQVFGSGLRSLTLVDPVFTFIAADGKTIAGSADPEAATKANAPALNINIENGAIKAADPQHNLALAITDISGTVDQTDDGTLDADLRGLLNGVATQLSLAVADTRRLRQRGSPSDVTLTSKAGQIVMSGRLGLAGTVQFDGSVSAETDDAQSFLSWMGVPLAGLGDGIAMALDGGLSVAHGNASLRNLAFALGEMQAKGDVAIQAAAPRPAITAALTFNTVNLNIYSSNGPAVAASPPDLTTDWREKPLPFADLKAADVDLTVTTGSFTVGALTAGQTELRAKLKDGTLHAHVQSPALASGKGSLDLTLSHDDATAMTLDLDLSAVSAKTFLGKAFGLTFLSGPLDLKTALKAKGSSPAQLISTLSGTVTLALKDGQIDGLDLAGIAGLVSTADAEGWGITDGAATALATADATARFADGIATLDEARLQATGVAATVTGQVDLLRRAVDLSVKPGKGLPLPVAARIRGPWDRPKLSAKLAVEDLLRTGDDDALKDAGNGLAKGAAKTAKKALKTLLGD